MREWCKKSAKALQFDIDAAGLENVPKDGPYVYASNHQSMLDILVLGAVLPGDFKWAAKRELMKVPFLGWHLRLSGHVPVDRGKGPKTVANVIKQFQAVLEAGKPLLIFPEGTRAADGVLKEFKSGGFVAAVKSNKPVLPVMLDGTWQLMDNGSVVPKCKIFVRVGAPIMPKTEGRESARVEDLRDRAYASVAELLKSVGGKVPDGPKKSDESVGDSPLA
jgi:1-acyl-sn-glycerol-3-phosphate acyltransferase